MSMKNPMTPAGFEPATFRFVAEHFNHWLPWPPKHGLNAELFLTCGSFSVQPALLSGICSLSEELMPGDSQTFLSERWKLS